MSIRPFLLALAAAGVIAAQTGEGYEFHVHVVNKLTSAPIPGANVVADSTKGGRAWGRTDIAGNFTGRSPSGQRMLTVTRPGYRMTGGAMARIVEIKSGEMNNVEVEMMPLGVIAGRVLDQYGEPVQNAIVRDLRHLDTRGMGEYYFGGAAATTDDRGEYRIWGIEPGRYYVAAEFRSEDVRRARPTRFQWVEVGGYALFPGTTDLGHAEEIEVLPGATKRIDDLRLNIQRPVSVSGHIKPASRAAKPALEYHRSGPHLGLNELAGRAAEVNADGSFELTALPGTYVLSASDRESGKVSKEVTVDVGEKDISGVELTLDVTYEITGRVLVDGPEAIDFSKVTLILGEPVKIAADGSFHTNASSPMAFYVLQGLPDDWYVKDIRVAGQRLTSRMFNLTPGNTEVLIALNARGATVEAIRSSTGSVLDAVLVVLLPENGPLPDPQNIIQARPDPSGKLIARGVPPGAYRVFALDATNFIYVMKPGMLMEKYSKSAPTIQVAAGEHKTIAVSPLKIAPE